MVLQQKLLLGVVVCSCLAVSTLGHPFGVLYDEEYVDEEEPMDPPSPFQHPRPMGFAKKSSPAPSHVLSYPTAFEGAQLNVKTTPPSSLQDQKFKIPAPNQQGPVFAPKPAERKPVQQDEIPPQQKPLAPFKKSVPNFVTLPPPDDAPPTTYRPKPVQKQVAPPKPVQADQRPNTPPPKFKPAKPVKAEPLTKKIRPASSVVSAKYAQHPSHTLANFPTGNYQHFSAPASFQMVPAAQQEYNFASIGGVGLLSGGSVAASDDESGESNAGHHYAQNQDSREVHDKDAKYEFMYRVQGDESKDHHEHDLKTEPSDFGHSEAREGDRTWGRYFVKLPDGRVQTVRYWADHTGYHAEVLFQGEAKHPDEDEHTPSHHAPSHHAPLAHQQPKFAEAAGTSAHALDEVVPYKPRPTPYAPAHDEVIQYKPRPSPYAPAHEVVLPYKPRPTPYDEVRTFQPSQSYAPTHEVSVDYSQGVGPTLGPTLKPFFASQPSFVGGGGIGGGFYALPLEASASRAVKVVEKPPKSSDS